MLALRAAACQDAAPDVAADEPEIDAQDWTFTGPFGTFDNAQLQRGFQVYKEVCSNCHSMRLLSYRNLGEQGGPEFPPTAVEALAGQVQVTDGPNDKGEMYQRPAQPSDRFPLAVRQCGSRARRQRRRVAARPFGDRQGARRRPRLHLCAADRLSHARRPGSSSRPACITTWPSRAIRSPCRRR